MNNIRQANPADSPAIKALISETLLRCVVEDEASHTKLFDEICTIVDSWAESPGDAVHLVCIHDEKIVGVALISHYERMNLLFVHPAHQKAGIGTALLDSALQACRQCDNIKQVTLNSSDYAAPFYRNYGFKPNGEPKDLPGGCIPLAIDLTRT